MFNFSLKFKRYPRSFLGIDIGTSSIRVVELGRRGQNHELKNYGEIATSSLQRPSFRIVERNSLLLSNNDVAKAISAIVREADIKTREVNFGIPDFSSFFTSFELPPMSEKELPQAVRYEARSYVPLPISEITLDWSVVEGQISDKSKTPLKILAVAIPNEIINQYQEIAKLCNLEMKDLEAEAFALARSASKKEIKITSIIDIGARSTTCNVLDRGVLKVSHSFNISGNELTETLSRSLKIDYVTAEEIKRNLGLQATGGSERNRAALIPLIDSILVEVKKIFQNFYQQEGKGVEKIILAGSTALLPGLTDYFAQELKKEVVIFNPFDSLIHPPILDEVLKEMGPAYAVAVGLALKELG